MPFDIGESYAGLLPISSDKHETRELYFWYFPSENPAAEDEITIWLNGGNLNAKDYLLNYPLLGTKFLDRTGM